MTSHHYTVYGITVASEMALPLPTGGDGSLGSVRLTLASPQEIALIAGTARLDAEWAGWFQYLPLADGRSYLRGWEMGEAVIAADGRHILCAPESAQLTESFFVYLLGQALSFALLKLGFEPLHATAVVIDGQAVALVAESGIGKSTLAASFVAAGCRLLTDDVLMLQTSEGRVLAYPGPQRLKLFPKAAGALGVDLTGAMAMNTQTTKLLVPLAPGRTCVAPVPLAAIYELVPPRGLPGPQPVEVTAVAGRDAALAIVQAAFNQRFVTRARLTRQFAAATSLAERVPVRRLSYPRVLARLPEVVGAVVADSVPFRSMSKVCAQ